MFALGAGVYGEYPEENHLFAVGAAAVSIDDVCGKRKGCDGQHKTNIMHACTCLGNKSRHTADDGH